MPQHIVFTFYPAGCERIRFFKQFPFHLKTSPFHSHNSNRLEFVDEKWHQIKDGQDVD